VSFKWRQYSLDERSTSFSFNPEPKEGQGFYLKYHPNDVAYMQQALNIAKLGQSAVGLDPMVGAIYVRHNRILAQGFHRALFSLHAEFAAFAEKEVDVQGSTLYVTLEPCAHDDYFPSCAQFVIRKGIQKVVIASLDPNPIENGDGVKLLLNAGIDVITGVLDQENQWLNRHYFERFK
jgi:diaminohydroxyphosphoribosylaminopyrimidine deaminase / 5-amino-6-(5-phosphoribosylamino)uracil reductase